MNIFGAGPLELLLIVVVALIVFGPAKLPEIMAQVGKAIGDFRRATSELSDEFNRTIQAELQETRSMVEETKSAVTDARSAVDSMVTGTPAPQRTALPGETLTLPTPNGTSGEPHAETTPNGAVTTEVPPPLADTSQWSWETSPPPATVAPSSETSTSPSSASATAQTEADEPTAAPSPEIALPATFTPAEPPSNPAPPRPVQERVARDELLPPY